MMTEEIKTTEEIKMSEEIKLTEKIKQQILAIRARFWSLQHAKYS